MEIKTKYGHLHTENRRYVTYRTKEHFMKKFQGFGVSVDVLKMLFDYNIMFIIIKYFTVDNKVKIYKSKLVDWFSSSKVYNNKGDEQKFISLKDMDYVGEEVVYKK